VTVKVILKLVVVFPLAYNVAFAWPMARIAILLEYKVITSFKPGLHNRLKDLVNIPTLCHLSIGVTNIIEY
jgi:hypothetical protein